MRTGLHLTIQDYFKNVKNHAAAASRPRRSSAAPAAPGTDFLSGLESAKAAMQNHFEKLGIQDYFKKPIRSNPVSATTMPVSLPSRASLPALAVPEPVQTMPATKNPQPRVSTQIDARAAIDASIRKAAAKYDLSPALLHAVVKAESNYDAGAVSPAGAQGLMQLMPGTADELGVEDPFDIEQNINGGARYLRRMLNRFDGDIEQALSAYNAGPGTVQRYNGKVPYAETRTYVAKVMRFADQQDKV